MLFDGLLEESAELITEILLRTEELTRGLHVHKDKMKKNANINKGIDNSEYVMMKAVSCCLWEVTGYSPMGVAGGGLHLLPLGL